HRRGVLFKAPRKLDYMRLVPVERETRHGVDMWRLDEQHLRRREGFALTDRGTDLVGSLDHAHYCIWCHEQQRDSCSSGLRDKKPVDIPQSETRLLKDVLALPWGFELYSLLTRWNPLNVRRPMPRPPTGKRVLVVGMGPAGFTLAHHLLNDGHTVIGIDGLKIEPLPAHVSGVSPTGKRVPFEPIRDIEALREPLDARVMAGFGGVAEYGITVRWDKNFLKLIRLLIERRERFAMFGGG